jgi:hypothetical protein
MLYPLPTQGNTLAQPGTLPDRITSPPTSKFLVEISYPFDRSSFFKKPFDTIST